jgi:hypothetical protein
MRPNAHVLAAAKLFVLRAHIMEVIFFILLQCCWICFVGFQGGRGAGVGVANGRARDDPAWKAAGAAEGQRVPNVEISPMPITALPYQPVRLCF